ncbi:MAG: tRNA epoxyqueuosine(34) reductase QueG [Firmicutes bacterium]|nr:tRNA epoxyqueuosine(34) reductase QueG [Bacillota bacterium]
MITLSDLTKFAQENNILAGVTPAREFTELKEALSSPVPFVEYTADKRTDPRLTLENARSVVCIGCPYPENILTDRGISIAAAGTDYHTTVSKMLDKLQKTLDITGLCFADTGPLVDRYTAYLCGLGYYGKNGFIISEKFGTMFFIGYIISDKAFDSYSKPVSGSCGDCRKCLDACPYGAINGGKMDYVKCVSYLTQLKGKLTDEQMKMIGTQVYGCDICQLSCPKNRGKVKINLNEKDYTHFFYLTNKQFKEKYGHTGIFWRGRATIVRNAVIAHINTGGDKKDIEKFLTDQNEVLRYTAEKLLGRKKNTGE